MKRDSLLPVETNLDLQKRNALVEEAERYLGFESVFVWNANINGIVLQLKTNNDHLYNFWRENWAPAPLEDHTFRPHGLLYAVTGMEATEPACWYHSETRTAIAFNSEFYGQIRSLALGLALDLAEANQNIHFLRGALVDVNGEGIAFLSQPDTGRTTHAFMLLHLEQARIHSHEWIYAEHLGGEKGRISTHTSERCYFIKSDVATVYPRLKEIMKRCPKHQGYVMLDPRWIGGPTKYIDTTRIKAAFLLVHDTKAKWVDMRLNPDEALDLLVHNPDPFFNPHMLIRTPERIESESEFYKELFRFVAAYKLNTAYPLLETHKRVREIVTNKEYLKPLGEKKPEPKPAPIEVVASLVDLAAVRQMVDWLDSQPNVEHPQPQEIRRLAEQYGTRTKFGNYNFVSTVKNRSAGLTIYMGSSAALQTKTSPRQKELLRNLPRTLAEVESYLKKAPFICVERTMGLNSEFSPRCSLYVSVHREEMVRLAHMVSQTLFDPRPTNGQHPHFRLVYIPEWQEKDRQIVALPEAGVTFVLGSDYYGEAKKGFLRMGMWHAKQRGMLGLHAGAKVIKVRDKLGKLRRLGMLLFGLTATGKTTHTCHHHGLQDNGQGIEILQDDVVFLQRDGGILGTEKGFYIKTDSLDPQIQPILYQAATRPDALFENVMVDYKGGVDFADETLTGNGRCIIQRDDLGIHKSEGVDLPPAEELDGLIVAFITRRNTVVPIVSRITPEQAAAAFMLGESIESSGSDPRRAGESVREVGTNPFIVGDEAEEGNIFYEIIKAHEGQIQCYLLNTGGVGEIREETPEGKIVKQKVRRIQIPEMAAIIRAVALGAIEWQKSPAFGYEVPKSVPGVNLAEFELKNFYSQEQIDEMVSKLRRERQDYMTLFPRLDPAIVKTV